MYIDSDFHMRTLQNLPTLSPPNLTRNLPRRRQYLLASFRRSGGRYCACARREPILSSIPSQLQGRVWQRNKSDSPNRFPISSSCSNLDNSSFAGIDKCCLHVACRYRWAVSGGKRRKAPGAVDNSIGWQDLQRSHAYGQSYP